MFAFEPNREGLMPDLVRASIVILILCASLHVAGCEKSKSNTPKEAALAFAKAFNAGDKAGVRETATGPADQVAMMEAMAGLASELSKAVAAAAEKFGAGNPFGKQLSALNPDMTEGITTGEYQIEGDTAKLVEPGRTSPSLSFKRINGEWRVHIDGVEPLVVAITVAKSDALAELVAEITAEIKAGSYANADAATEAFAAKMKAKSSR